MIITYLYIKKLKMCKVLLYFEKNCEFSYKIAVISVNSIYQQFLFSIAQGHQTFMITFKSRAEYSSI